MSKRQSAFDLNYRYQVKADFLSQQINEEEATDFLRSHTTMRLSTIHNFLHDIHVYKRSNAEINKWQTLWRNAWNNMPRHSATMLLQLLGSYRIYGYWRTDLPCEGNNYKAVTYQPNQAQHTVYNNYCRGSKPKSVIAAARLELLGGPHGETLAKAMAKVMQIEFK